MPKRRCTHEPNPPAGPGKRIRSSTQPRPPHSNSRTRRARRIPTVSINSLPTLPLNNYHRPPLTLFGWGCGDTGQLGLGPIPEDGTDEWNKPHRNTLIERMVEQGVFGTGVNSGLVRIAAGGMHSLAIDGNGTIWSFGINDEGALGRETRNIPNPLNPGEFLPVEDLEASPQPIQALIGDGFRAVKVAAGDNVSAALDSEGRLRVWGSFRDSHGPLGFSNLSPRQFIPKSISPRLSQSSSETFVSIAAGQNHLLALTSLGNIYTFGNGEYGQLGRRIITRRKINGTVPEKIILSSHSNKAVVIGAGLHQSFAVDVDGVVWGWGLNTLGQIGVGASVSTSSPDAAFIYTPTKVIGLSKEELGGEVKIIEIASGECFTLFLASNGNVYSCGSSLYGRLGLAKTDQAFNNNNRQGGNFEECPLVFQPALVTFPESGLLDDTDEDPIIHISSGSRNSLAITRDGAMFSWGQHNQGGLGLGSCREVYAPTIVIRRREGSWKARAIACGGPHCLALMEKTEEGLR